jgi:hypothetical protein
MTSSDKKPPLEKYFLSVALVKMAKKSAGNHLFIQNNNKNCREITLLSLSNLEICIKKAEFL